MTPESAAVLAFDPDEVLRAAGGAPLPTAEVLAAARRRNRGAAEAFLARTWTLSLRGVVAEPNGPAWSSRLRATVAEALAARLLGYGVPADLVALLLAGWASAYTDPPLDEDEVLAIVRGLAPLAEELAA